MFPPCAGIDPGVHSHDHHTERVPPVRGDRPQVTKYLISKSLVFHPCAEQTRRPRFGGVSLSCHRRLVAAGRRRAKAGKTAGSSSWQADLKPAFRLRCIARRCIGHAFPPFAEIDLMPASCPNYGLGVPPVRGDRPTAVPVPLVATGVPPVCGADWKTPPRRGFPFVRSLAGRGRANGGPQSGKTAVLSKWQADLTTAFLLRRCEDRCIWMAVPSVRGDRPSSAWTTRPRTASFPRSRG